jgi:hypothetical protein
MNFYFSIGGTTFHIFLPPGTIIMDLAILEIVRSEKVRIFFGKIIKIAQSENVRIFFGKIIKMVQSEEARAAADRLAKMLSIFLFNGWLSSSLCQSMEGA